ncbi:5'-nucleotidase, lipoprotein e(P4) family [Hyphobacterium sp. CCMP332]|nr:5'-nucleotidase, lipoprotein e(P4) family [Hyphobacterium sp. CCMP332]
MIHQHLSFALNIVVFILLSACSNSIDKTNPNTDLRLRDYSVQSVLWQQHSAEHRALCYQAYNIALDNLKDLEAHNEKPLAIISDLDETVIDNSFYNAMLIEKNQEYSKKSWKEWVLLEKAKAIPGAIDFFTRVKEMGIEIFYISNRSESEKTATINNLQKLGLPNADSSFVFLKTTSSGKEIRRKRVLQNYDVVLYMGDNMSDFSELFDNKGTVHRNALTDSLRSTFGRKFIVFPNSIYGDWESKGIYEGNYQLNPSAKDSIRRSKLISY